MPCVLARQNEQTTIMFALLMGHIETALHMMALPGADLTVKFTHSDEPAEVHQYRAVNNHLNTLLVFVADWTHYLRPAPRPQVPRQGTSKLTIIDCLQISSYVTIFCVQFSIANSALVTVDGIERRFAVKLLKSFEDQINEDDENLKEAGIEAKTRYTAACSVLQEQLFVALSFSVELCEWKILTYELPPHENVVHLLGYCVDFPREAGRAMALLMPFHSGGSLKSYVKTHKLSSATIVRFATHMARAIEHLYNHEVIHKDIALRNFVLTAEGVPVLLDFGLSAVAEATTAPFTVVLRSLFATIHLPFQSQP